MSSAQKLSFPLFQRGKLVMTRGISKLIEQGMLDPLPYFQRHQHGDWGDLSEDVRCANDAALKHGDRLFSSYQINPQLELWIITECDRSVTTLLLPGEY
jgi:hypothetical protein